MPATKTAARKATRKIARQPAKRTNQRTLSPAHKTALAKGRAMSATVDRYLASVNTPKRRGRKVSKPALEQRLAKAQHELRTSGGVAKVLAAQEIRDLTAKIDLLSSTVGVDAKRLETDFVKIAKQFGEQRGVSYGAWRDAGVAAVVLKRAGIARTRG